MPVPENTEETVQQLLNGELRRANTQGTLRDFAESDMGKRGGILALSRQPYALHQHGQLLSAPPQERFPVLETATGKIPLEDINVHHALGSIAKYIYAVHERARAALPFHVAERACKV